MKKNKICPFMSRDRFYRTSLGDYKSEKLVVPCRKDCALYIRTVDGKSGDCIFVAFGSLFNQLKELKDEL